MTITLSVTVDPSASLAPEFEDMLESLRASMDALANIWGVPDVNIELHWVAGINFVPAVQEILDSTNVAVEYATERLGGVVKAKTMRLADDHSASAIVIDADGLVPQGEPFAMTVALTAHEFSHAVINRARVAAGDFEWPTSHHEQTARWIARIALDEYRADRIAGGFLSRYVTVEWEGEQVGLGLGHLHEDAYWATLQDVLGNVVWPGWPDLVDSYRQRALTLEGLVARIQRETDQTFTLIAHSQAVADDGPDAPAPFDGVNGEHRGAVLYLEPCWSRLYDAFKTDAMAVQLDVAELAERETAILNVGQEAILDMWEKLGITHTPMGPESDWINVSAPHR